MDPSYKAERTFIKLLLGGLVAVVLLIVLGIGTFHFYRQWQGRHLVRRAEAYLDGGDSRAALLTAKRAFQLDSSNAAACRLLARIAEREGQSSAIDWRQQVMTVTPDPVGDGIALAKTALRFDQIAVAAAALARIGVAGADRPAYHEAEAQLAVAKKDPAGAEQHLAEAARLDPSNKAYQLNLAVFQLQSSSPEVRAGASKLLQQFMNDKSLRVPAARALRDYAAQRKDVPALLGITELLYGYPEATLRDRISYLQVLHALGRPEFALKLTELQNEAVTDSNKLTVLLSWMNSNHLAVLAIDWSRRLPAEMVNKLVVRVAVADSYVATEDADGLQQWCKKEKWGDLEFLRHAYLAWALRKRGDALGFKSEWNSALHDAAANGERLFSLEQDAVKWNWKEDAENLLWLLAKDPQKQDAALAALNQHYREKGDTAQLYRVIARLCEIRPNDDDAQNNRVQLSLLLNLDLENASDVAKQLYQKAPRNAIFASTYAFSLYRKGKYHEAVKIMSELDPADLQKPAMAAYYGVFLAAAGDKSKAEEYLKRGSEARLLPEEKALVESAGDKLNASSQ